MPAVISDDALNRYRITHPDKDLRALCRRIHRLPHAGSSASDASGSKSAMAGLDLQEADELKEDVDLDVEREREMTRLDVLKWKITVERLMAGARNLGRQGERYRARAEETARQAEALEATLEADKRLLTTKLKERDHMIRCDEVYDKITARPKTKEELKDQIITLRAQIDSYRASHAAYLEIVQKRVDAFSAITPIVDEVKAMRLPVETSDAVDEIMDVDDSPSGGTREEELASESERKLSGMALPFQPSQPTVPGPSVRSSAPIPPTAPSRSTSHALPHRPSRGSPSIPSAPSAPRSAGSVASGRAASASLPQRPSALRSSVTPGRNMLEEGEVEGEEGEVDDRKGGRRGGRRR